MTTLKIIRDLRNRDMDSAPAAPTRAGGQAHPEARATQPTAGAAEPRTTPPTWSQALNKLQRRLAAAEKSMLPTGGSAGFAELKADVRTGHK